MLRSFWRPIDHSDQENIQWAYLRAVEWVAWPSYLSQPVVPLLLLFYPWWAVVGSLTALNVGWAAVRYRGVHLAAVYWGPLFVKMKWITMSVAVVLLVRSGHAALAILSLVWCLGLAAAFAVPGQIGRVQSQLMHEMGYDPAQEPL